MRLYPPADFLGREAIVDCEVGGMRVPKGMNLFMSQWVMHRDERYFRDPLAFVPDRWTPEFEKSLPRFVYFPFGAGPRYCIGQTFATTEAAHPSGHIVPALSSLPTQPSSSSCGLGSRSVRDTDYDYG